MSPGTAYFYKGMYQVGMMSMEPQTGYVNAWVGGRLPVLQIRPRKARKAQGGFDLQTVRLRFGNN